MKTASYASSESIADRLARFRQGGWNSQGDERADTREEQDDPVIWILIEHLGEVEESLLVRGLEKEIREREQSAEKQGRRTHQGHDQGAFRANPRGEQDLGTADEGDSQVVMHAKRTRVPGRLEAAKTSGDKVMRHWIADGIIHRSLRCQSFQAILQPIVAWVPHRSAAALFQQAGEETGDLNERVGMNGRAKR